MRLLTVLILTLFLAAPALAHQCPALIAQIDHQLSHEDLPGDVADQVQELRDEGQSLHDSGQHDESEEVLGRAIELLAEHAHDVGGAY